MNPEAYARMYEVEERHFWYRGTRAVILDQVRDLLDRNLEVADIGCGTGALLNRFPSGWRTVGLDPVEGALAFTRSRGHMRLVRGDGQRLPLKTAAFDLAFALDMIEHCEDDAKVADELFRILKPGGRLVTTVPAYQLLFGPHDRTQHHFRRYRRSQFRRLLERAGFRLELLSYYNTLLFPPAAAVRLLERVRDPGNPAGDMGYEVGPLNEVFTKVFSLEKSLLRRVSFPFGLSVIAVARRART